MIVNLCQTPISVWCILSYELGESLCVCNTISIYWSSSSISCKSRTLRVYLWLCLDRLHNLRIQASYCNSIWRINFYPRKILLIRIFWYCDCLSSIGRSYNYICSNNSYSVYSTCCSLNTSCSLNSSSLIIVICVICAYCDGSWIDSWFRISSQRG